MDENQKKGGGASDISNLKARLSARKTQAGMAAVPPGGMPLPPGAAQAPLPAPPGFPQPEAPATPSAEPAAAVDPRRDPFAVPTSAPAYYGYEPLPGVDDGRPAEQLNQEKVWPRVALFAGAALLVAAAGFTLGKIQWARANMNKTIDQAADIKAEVDVMAKKLQSIKEEIEKSPSVSKNVPDLDLAKTLGAMAPDPRKADADATYRKLFHTNYYYLDNLALDRLFNYYNDTIKLYALLANHAKRTIDDQEPLTNYAQESTNKSNQIFGVTLDLSDAIPKANFVELGNLICQDPEAKDCKASELKGFKYRTATGGQWYDRPIKGKPDQIIYPIAPSPLFATVAAGSPDVLAYKEYRYRMRDILGILQKLAGEQKELQTALDAAAKKRKVNEYIVF